MLTPADVATHWPYVRSHLLIDRRPSMDRTLRLLAEGQAWHDGEPVAMSRTRLRALGLTPGEAGRVWATLEELERLGVVWRYRGGGGRRPDLWSLAPHLANRWRMPWRWSGREVEIVIASCTCRADSALAARFPGQGVAALVNSRRFDLPADAHLGLRGDFRAANDKDRAARPAATRENAPSPRGYGAPLVNSPREVGGLRPPQEEEGVRTLQTAIEGATRRRLWGAALEPLREAAAVTHDVDELATELASMAPRYESVVQLAAQAPGLARMLGGQAHENRRRRARSGRAPPRAPRVGDARNGHRRRARGARGGPGPEGAPW